MGIREVFAAEIGEFNRLGGGEGSGYGECREGGEQYGF